MYLEITLVAQAVLGKSTESSSRHGLFLAAEFNLCNCKSALYTKCKLTFLLCLYAHSEQSNTHC